MKIFVYIFIIFSTLFFNGFWRKVVVASTILVKYDHIAKSSNDRRSYRGLVLHNGLKVLLINDRFVEKSIVALSVGVGSLDDTLDLPGLANLMALMLMKGSTEENPRLGDFGEFLQRNDGNIFIPRVTAKEQIFSFNIKHSHLVAALEKFVQFFIAPILSHPRVLEHCLLDIKDDYNARSKNDADRIFEVEKSLSERNDFYNHFYLGLPELYRHTKKLSWILLMKRVKKFYEMWYSSNIMCLVVLGQESLDNLQKIVAPIFVNIENNDKQPMLFEFKHHPWGPKSLGHKVYIESVSEDTKFLRLIFPVPNDRSSSAYVTYFLLHGGPDSLVVLLHKKALCTTLVANFTCDRGISFFVIKCDLNTYSVEFQVDYIIFLIFQYLKLLDPDNPPRWISKENWKTYKLAFSNMIPHYESPVTIVQDLASDMQVHPLNDILMNEYIHDQWNPTLIKEFLLCLKPEKMNVTIVDHDFKNITLDREEKYYGTRYAVEKISEELILTCNTKYTFPGLQFPQPNKFFPEDFSLYPMGKDEPKHPYKLFESSKYEIWFLQDCKYRTPSLLFEFQLFSSFAQHGPIETAMWCVLKSSLNRVIERQLRYYATMALIELDLKLSNTGIMHIKVAGYHDKLAVFLVEILSVITNFRSNVKGFNIFEIEASQDELLKMRVTKDHVFQTEWYTEYLQEADGWTADTIIHVGSLLQFEDLKRFLSKAFRRIFVRGFIHGNYTKEKALEVIEILESSFGSSTGMLQQEIMLQRRSAEITDGSHYVLQGFNKNTDYGYSSFFQLSSEPIAYLLAKIITHSCVSNLLKKRENESISGKCMLLETQDIKGVMIILSSKEHPRNMDRKVEAFLRGVNNTLMMLSDAELRTIKENVQTWKYKKFAHQIELSDFYWNEIESRRYYFSRYDDELKQLLSLKPVNLVHYFQKTLGVGSPQRRKLAMHIFPTEKAAKNDSDFMDRFIPAGNSTDLSEPCRVICPAGTFSGTLNSSILKPNVAAFCSYRGIQYGKAPIGDLRFAPPEPMESKGEKHATADSDPCPQKTLRGTIIFNENCLSLNVYTPQVWAKYTSVPVMVFLFGGSFTGGTASSEFIGPDYLVPKNVILVTVNSRVNVFGFLDLQVPGCSGNMGLRDAILALQWVQKNIKMFGGDPNCVTLFGGSSGAISSFLIALSPLAKGLFHRLFLDSPVLTTYYVKNTTFDSSLQFAKYAGYTGDLNRDPEKVVRFLKNISSENLLTLYLKFEEESRKTDDYCSRGPSFWPVIDSNVENAVLPASLEELGKTIPGIDIVCGQNDADGTAILLLDGKENEIVPYIKEHVDVYLRSVNPTFFKSERTLQKVAEAVKNRYFDASNKTDDDKVVKLMTFLLYIDFYKKISIFQASYSASKIRLYQFRFDVGGFNYIKKYFLSKYRGIEGVAHGDEMFYVFYVPFVFINFSPLNRVLDAQKKRMIDTVTTWVANFAKTGNPNKGSNVPEVNWEPNEPSHNRYLEINTKSRMIEGRIHEEDYRFFEELLRTADESDRY